MRAITVAIALLAMTAAGCASSEAPGREREPRAPFRPAEFKLPVEVAGAEVALAPAPKLTRTVQADLPAESPAPRLDAADEGGPWVRLRGSNEIHVSTCEKVRSAPGEAAPASRDTGAPCPLCLQREAAGADR
jgi:hypothetical protein